MQWFWGSIERERAQHPNDVGEPARPADHVAVVEFFAASSARLREALAGTPSDVEVWTWFPSGHNVRFLRRRQAHEALIHRLDAELAAGAVTDLDPELATDGVAEVLETMHSIVPGWAAVHATGAIGRVVTVDTGASWLVRTGAWSGTSPRDGAVYTDKPSITIVDVGEPVFDVSGRAGDLDAWLWNRPARGDIAVTGDSGGFVRAIKQGVQ